MEKARYNFPAAHRLKKEGEISGLFREGNRVSQPGMSLIFKKTGGRHPGRVAFSTRRNIGGAVLRNTARRRMREFFRLNCGRIAPAADLMFVAARVMSYLETSQAMTGLLRRAGLWTD
jgi:ribonuclease P protein component